MGFEWNSDGEPRPALQAGKANRSFTLSRRRHLITGFALAAIVAVAAVTCRSVWRETDLVSGRIEDDVLASFYLITEAASNGDHELVNAFLSGSDPEWSDALVALVASGDYGQRSGFELENVSADLVPEPEVEMAPDLRSAVLSWPVTYTVDIGGGLNSSVQLKQTGVYRAGPVSWLLSPPTIPFWGPRETSRGSILTLTYPGRDAELGRRLALDLDEKLWEACALLESSACPTGLRVELDLSPDLSSMAWNSPEHWLIPADRLAMPSPTLLGVPMDESGYQALYRGYAVNLLSNLIVELTGYECCANALLFRAILDKQLSLLGLRPWPLSPVQYGFLVDQTILWDQIQADGLATDLIENNHWRQLYGLVDFLLANSAGEAILTRMQRQLGAPVDTLWSWAARYLEPGYELRNFQDDWLEFVGQRAEPFPMAETANGNVPIRHSWPGRPESEVL